MGKDERITVPGRLQKMGILSHYVIVRLHPWLRASHDKITAYPSFSQNTMRCPLNVQHSIQIEIIP